VQPVDRKPSCLHTTPPRSLCPRKRAKITDVDQNVQTVSRGGPVCLAGHLYLSLRRALTDRRPVVKSSPAGVILLIASASRNWRKIDATRARRTRIRVEIYVAIAVGGLSVGPSLAPTVKYSRSHCLARENHVTRLDLPTGCLEERKRSQFNAPKLNGLFCDE